MTALGALLWPGKYTMCPEWTVRVVDAGGAAMAGVRVDRYCDDYSTDLYRSHETLRTDSGGSARFAIHHQRMPYALRLFGAISSALSGGVHASFGRKGYVSALVHSPAPENVTQWYGEEDRLSHTIQANPAPSP